MRLIDDLREAHLSRETVVTIGAFDGVHRGHQALIRQLVQRGRETQRLSALVTFHPHPSAVLQPSQPLRYLTTPGEKAAILEGLSLDILAILTFDRLVAQTRAEDFVRLLLGHLRMRELWIGQDFTLGRNREGDAAALTAMGGQLGFEVRVVEPVVVDGQIISSTRIRCLLAEGNIREATRLLGRYPSLAGEVVIGAHRGHSLGFPTANLEVREERALPPDGVYAVFAMLGADRYPAVANIGVRPSFDNGLRTVETYIFSFDQDIYGCDLVVEFVERLRPELRFEKVEDLKTQIAKDVESARRILQEEPVVGSMGPQRRQPAGACRRSTLHNSGPAEDLGLAGRARGETHFGRSGNAAGRLAQRAVVPLGKQRRGLHIVPGP
jgi:riboflavin kinase/FMN adenylyltransferase